MPAYDTRAFTQRNACRNTTDRRHGLRLGSQNVNLALGTVITAYEETTTRRVPGSSRQADAVALRQAVGRARAGAGGREDIVVALHAIRRRDGIVGAALELLERDLHDFETGRGLAVPGAVEGHVHVLDLLVEGGVDRRAVGLEGQTGCDRLAVAGGVAEGRVGCQDEVLSRLEAGERRRVPDRETGRVAEPLVTSLQRVAN